MAKKGKQELSNEVDAMSDVEFFANEAELGKSLHLIQSKSELINPDKIDLHPEWQPRLSTNPSRLHNSICTEGLATPPKVFKNTKGVYADGKFHALDGRHRWAALLVIQEKRPDVWKRHQFNKGIPCQVYRDLTDQQILDLRTDEGRNQEPLCGKVECFRALLPHYEANRSDRQIESDYWRILADTCCSSSKRRELHDSFTKSENPRDFIKEVHSATYIHQMRFRALYNSPLIVREQWANGEMGKTIKGKVAAKLTDAELRKLAAAHKADLAEDEASHFELGYSFEKPGPGVITLLETTLDDKKHKSSEPKIQVMSNADRQKHIEHGKCKAEKIIFAAVQGNPNSQAQLDNIFNQLGRYETADTIDNLLMDVVITAISKRKQPVDSNTLKRIAKLIDDAPIVLEPSVKEPNVKGKKKSVVRH